MMDEQLEFFSDAKAEMRGDLTRVIREIFGDNVWDDSVENTADRVIRYWLEYAPEDEFDHNFTTFPATANQLIVVKDIEFSSICAHHLLPFYGKVHVGYVPNELMVGLSKIPRLVDHWAKRPSTQEALTARIASDLKHRLSAMGVAVVIESRHTCMACRGVRKHNGAMVTSEMRGIFLTAEAARMEFLNLIKVGGV
jgi:GTP cyclohydrolase I